MNNNIPSTISTGSDPVSINRTQTNIPRINPQLIQLQTRRLTLLDNLVYEYNRNNRDYHQNIHCLIDAIQNTQINPVQPPIRPRPNEQINAQSHAQINAQSHEQSHAQINAQSRAQSRAQRHAASRATNEQDILSYFFYPLNNGPLNSPLNSNYNNYTNILSDYQVNRATENIIFNTNDPQNNDDTRCSITMDVFMDGDELLRIKGCGHRFKKNALLEWFNRDPRCPMCRYNLHEYIEPPIEPPIDPLNSALIDQIVDPIVDPFTNSFTDSFTNSFTNPHDNIIIAADTLTENPYRYPINRSMDQATNNRPVYSSSNLLSNLIHNALTNSTNSELGNGLGNGLGNVLGNGLGNGLGNELGNGLVLLDDLQQNSQLIQNLTQLFTGFGQNSSTVDSSMNDTI